MAYEIRIAGQWYSTDDLTGEELEAIEKVTGESWYHVNPARSIAQYTAVAGAFLVRLGKTHEEAAAIIRATSRRQLDEAWRVPEEDDRPDSYEDGIPLQVGGSTTPTSSPAPEASTGPPT